MCASLQNIYYFMWCIYYYFVYGLYDCLVMHSWRLFLFTINTRVKLYFLSLFPDTFTLTFTDTNESVGLLNTGIAWVSDKEVKFNNPSCKCLCLSLHDCLSLSMLKPSIQHLSYSVRTVATKKEHVCHIGIINSGLCNDNVHPSVNFHYFC